jgi:hypothetical protein
MNIKSVFLQHVTMLTVIMMAFIMLTVILLIVITLGIIRLSVILQNFILFNVILQGIIDCLLALPKYIKQDTRILRSDKRSSLLQQKKSFIASPRQDANDVSSSVFPHILTE